MPANCHARAGQAEDDQVKGLIGGALLIAGSAAKLQPDHGKRAGEAGKPAEDAAANPDHAVGLPPSPVSHRHSGRAAKVKQGIGDQEAGDRQTQDAWRGDAQKPDTERDTTPGRRSNMARRGASRTPCARQTGRPSGRRRRRERPEAGPSWQAAHETRAPNATSPVPKPAKPVVNPAAKAANRTIRMVVTSGTASVIIRPYRQMTTSRKAPA